MMKQTYKSAKGTRAVTWKLSTSMPLEETISIMALNASSVKNLALISAVKTSEFFSINGTTIDSKSSCKSFYLTRNKIIR